MQVKNPVSGRQPASTPAGVAARNAASDEGPSGWFRLSRKDAGWLATTVDRAVRSVERRWTAGFGKPSAHSRRSD